MNTHLLDPWTDAQLIAQRLSHTVSQLTVVIGAQEWCQKCRALKPAFDALALAHNDENHVWLWLDLDEHADFLDGFIPDDLPLLIRHEGALVTHALLPGTTSPESLLAQLASPARIDHAGLPDMRTRLALEDWAT